jgi:hypothetical protein
MATWATKFYKLSCGLVGDDEDRNPDWMYQILCEVLEVVAPSTSSRTYAVYKVPLQHFRDHLEMSAPGIYDVFALIKCVHEPRDGNVVTELHAELEEALEQSDMYTFFGCEQITEITSQEFDDLSRSTVSSMHHE